MDHNSYHYQPFNHYLLNHHLQQRQPTTPASELPLPFPYYDTPDTPTPAPAPASPSDFIYNSSANATASIFRPSPPSHPSLFSVPNESASTLTYPSGAMGYGPSRPVEQSFPTYLPSLPEPSLPEPRLPEPTPGFEEHRRQRQRQSTMNMGPGPSKSVPPPLALRGDNGGKSGSSRGSSESTVVIKQEEGSSSPVLVSVPMKRWEPREPRMPTEEPGQQIKVDGKGREKEMFDPFGNAGLENDIGSGRGSGSGSGTWEDRGEEVMERVIPPIVPSIGMGMDLGMGTDMGMGMGMGMEPTLPKMGLFKPIRWDGPSSSSASRSSRSSKANKARRARRAWEMDEESGRTTYGTRTGTRTGNSRNGNEETEDEQPINALISSSSHSRSPKRLKTAPSGCTFRSASASAETETETETTTTIKIKQEPGLSPSPSAIFARIPMYNYNGTSIHSNGYESPGHDNSPSSRSISPLTRVPTPRRLLFPTSSRASTGTGTNSQLSLRGVSKQLKKRNRQMALDQEGSREESREQSRERSRERERRGEGFWSLAGGGQGQTPAQGASVVHEQHRGSSEEREEGWTTISGSSEEGEVSSHYENSYSYSCGQERDRNNAPGNTHRSSPFLPCRDQEWCHPFSSATTSPASVPGSSSSARYGPGSVPSLSASQERMEQYKQAIQMVQDTCLEATKRYIRAHCVNRGARGGGSPDTNPAPRETVETRSARKARRKRKLNTRRGSSCFSSSSFSSSSSSPAPSRRRRKNRKRTTTTPPFSPSSPKSQAHNDIPCTDSLLPNISQICTLLWSRSQSLRLHDIDSIELHTAQNMYWLLSWAETVAFAVPPTPLSATNGRTSNTSEASSSFSGVPSLEEDLGARGRWHCRERDHPEHAPSPGDVLNGAGGYMWRRRDSEEEEEEEEGLGGIEVLESKNGAVCWSQQWNEMWMRVFEEGGMLCEFLGYGEGVERIARVREFYGF